MKEDLLQHIWTHLLFDTRHLVTTCGKPIQIIQRGSKNTNQGADFLNAKLEIDGKIWAGNIEVHVNTHDWLQHKHQNDSNYKNVILHVVWKHNQELTIGFYPLFTLELSKIISPLKIQAYSQWQNSFNFIPCENQLAKVQNLVIENWLERMLAERFDKKYQIIYAYYLSCSKNWEQTAWWLLCSYSMQKLNKDAFTYIANNLPYALLQKYRHSPKQLLALLWGVGNLFENSIDKENTSVKELAILFDFLQKKHTFSINKLQWQYLRTRPANFPEVRMAQLAQLILHTPNLFSSLMDVNNINQLKQIFKNSPLANYGYSIPGNDFLNHLIINVIAPLQYAYAKASGNSNQLISQAETLLQQTPVEKNTIVNKFQQLQKQSNQAFYSQALLELYHNYCTQKRCLECSIGVHLLKETFTSYT